MARNSVTVAYIVFVCSVVLVVVGSAAAALVRSTPSDQDRVYDFTVSENKDSVSWTAFGREWIVDLELSDVVEDNTDYYLGTLVGDESGTSVVSFALLPGLGLSGMIATGTTTWWIRALPVIENDLSEDEDKLGIFMIREEVGLNVLLEQATFEAPLIDLDLDLGADVDVKRPSACPSGVSLDVDVGVDVEVGKKRQSTTTTKVTTYKVAVLFDQKWATASTNPWSSQADTLGLFNDVNAIYKAAGLGQFKAVYLKQITNTKTTLNEMLSYFSDTASTSIAAISDNTYTNYIWLVGQNVGGLAYVGTACKGTKSAQNRKTAVAGLVSYSRLFTVKTIAHELAHNRGASHQFDNACSSTVKTGCQCSVMSYCFPAANNNPQGAVNWFSDISINEMKTAGCY